MSNRKKVNCHKLSHHFHTCFEFCSISISSIVSHNIIWLRLLISTTMRGYRLSIDCDVINMSRTYLYVETQRDCLGVSKANSEIYVVIEFLYRLILVNDELQNNLFDICGYLLSHYNTIIVIKSIKIFNYKITRFFLI